jgi:acetate---CoA ligase (ADP-forming) subunit beta
VSAPTITLSESASKLLLSQAGVPVAPESVVTSAQEAAEAALTLGFPVVAKLCGDRIAHKTERGLVRLNLGTVEAVAAATTELFFKALPEDGDVSVLIAPMIRGNRELIAGVATDPQFGKTVMIGVGGVLAEAVADVVFRLVPISRLDALEMIEDMATQSLLGAFRGEPEVDRERLVDVLVGLSRVVEAHPHIVSIDVNPLIVANGVPIAVDALVELAQ